MKTMREGIQVRSGPALELTLRIAASLLGAYGFVWGAVMLVTVLGVGAGMSYGDAQTLAHLLAFLIYLVCFCWAFSAHSARRVWLVFVAGGGLMSAVAWVGSRALT